MPSLSGSGKFATPWLRMQAEYATGPDLEPLEAPEVFALLVLPTCATLAPEELPQAAASTYSATTPGSASVRKAARFRCEPSFVACVVSATLVTSSPSQLT